ncbi:MAG: sporulation protein [Oscillospiraceae bacterium]|nr:sporulation protein [Oscillospiraceae bacterium]
MKQPSKPKRRGLLDRARDAFDLPGDVLHNLPRVTVAGGNRLLVEHHRGLLDYGDAAIVIAGGNVTVRVVGDGLRLRAMTAEALLITGSVFGVEFIY